MMNEDDTLLNNAMLKKKEMAKMQGQNLTHPRGYTTPPRPAQTR
jgi:hypothetical protein